MNTDAANGLAIAELPDLIDGFLTAREFRLEQPQPGLFLGRRGADAPIAVIAPQVATGAGDETPLDIDQLEALLRAANAAGVTQITPLVTTTKKGLGPAQQSRLTAARGSARYPLQFADWYFRADPSDDDATPLSAILRDVIKENRVRARGPQPYHRLRTTRATAEGAPDGYDLFDALRSDMAGFPERPRLRVISGHAGVGKTVLVAELLQTLQDSFNDSKRRSNGLASRPLLFEPIELGSRSPDTLDDLIEILYGSKIGEHMPATAFRWLAERGYTTWIFDGLDEFYRRQRGFFEALAQMLDAPGARTQIIICTRDSLLSSADALQDFLDTRIAAAPDQIELYELARWDAEAKRAFVTTLLRADGVREAALERRTGELVGALQADPNLAALTDLPFYCNLFVTALQDGKASELRDEFALLQFAVDALIDREAGKLSIEWDVFVSDADLESVRGMAAGASKRGLSTSGDNPFADALRRYGQENLEYLLGGAAHFYRFAASDARALGEVSVDEWREVLSPSFIDAHLDDATEERVQLALMQFAFFGRGRGADGQQTISFVHDLIADYLAAKYAFALIEAGPDRPQTWRQALGQRADIVDTVFYRYFAARIAADPALAAAGKSHLSHPLMAEPARTHLQRLLSA